MGDGGDEKIDEVVVGDEGNDGDEGRGDIEANGGLNADGVETAIADIGAGGRGEEDAWTDELSNGLDGLTNELIDESHGPEDDCIERTGEEPKEDMGNPVNSECTAADGANGDDPTSGDTIEALRTTGPTEPIAIGSSINIVELVPDITSSLPDATTSPMLIVFVGLASPILCPFTVPIVSSVSISLAMLASLLANSLTGVPVLSATDFCAWYWEAKS